MLMFLVPFSFAFDESTAEFSQAEKHFEAGQYAQAESEYRQALDKYKTMGDLAAYIKVRLGECCQYQKKTEAAISLYREVQTNHASSPLAGQMQEKIARAYYNSGNYEKAAPEFEKMAVQNEAKIQSATTAGLKAATATQERANENLGYSAFCYKKAGHEIKAASIGMRIKNAPAQSKVKKGGDK